MAFPLIPLLVRALVPILARKIFTVIVTSQKESEMEIILGLLRHALTAGGGILVAKGYLESATVETIVGAIVTMAGALWSVYDKKKNALTGTNG